MSKNPFEPDVSFEELTPEARKVFDWLINKTRFLNAFEHILKAREYEQTRKDQGKISLRKMRKLKKQVAALNIPEGMNCVSTFRLAQAEYYQAKYYFDEAVRELYLRTFKDDEKKESD